MGHDAAYEKIIQEAVAGQIEAVMKNFLEENPDIAGKLASGQPLDQHDIVTISDALDEAYATGEIKEGFQFIQGFLVYIAPPQQCEN